MTANETNDYYRSSIYEWVWSGFYTQEEVREMLTERIYDEGADVDEAHLQQLAGEQWVAWQHAQAAWPAVTDCDRLDAAFQQLNQQQIIALQNAGYTTSDGHDDTTEALDVLPDPDAVLGYCFYHGQDTERAVRNEGLWLAFGSMSDAEADTLAVGRRVQQTLESQGLTVDWNGTANQRISVPSLVWQRRPGTLPGLRGWYARQADAMPGKQQ